MLCLTGGEPMLHPELYAILGAAQDAGIPCGMTTNGTLIGVQEASRLAELGMGTVSVSLDGMEAEHDWLRQHDGSFSQTVRGIEALRDAGLLVQVTTVVHRNNIECLEALREFVRSLGGGIMEAR